MQWPESVHISVQNLCVQISMFSKESILNLGICTHRFCTSEICAIWTDLHRFDRFWACVMHLFRMYMDCGQSVCGHSHASSFHGIIRARCFELSYGLEYVVWWVCITSDLERSRLLIIIKKCLERCKRLSHIRTDNAPTSNEKDSIPLIPLLQAHWQILDLLTTVITILQYRHQYRGDCHLDECL